VFLAIPEELIARAAILIGGQENITAIVSQQRIQRKMQEIRLISRREQEQDLIVENTSAVLIFITVLILLPIRKLKMFMSIVGA